MPSLHIIIIIERTQKNHLKCKLVLAKDTPCCYYTSIVQCIRLVDVRSVWIALFNWLNVQSTFLKMKWTGGKCNHRMVERQHRHLYQNAKTEFVVLEMSNERIHGHWKASGDRISHSRSDQERLLCANRSHSISFSCRPISTTEAWQKYTREWDREKKAHELVIRSFYWL